MNILSIDGGGIRGIIPAVILNYIEKGLQRQSGNPNATLADYFDLIAGTSAGGILACFYLMPPNSSNSCYFASEAIDMYATRGAEIFDRKCMRKGIAKPKYHADGLEKVLKECTGDVTLADTRKNCLVTAYDVTERKAVFFTSPEARKYPHRNYLLRDVARATSAAPTYFELAAIKSLGGAWSYLIDGAMYAGNPTMCAVVEAMKIRLSSSSSSSCRGNACIAPTDDTNNTVDTDDTNNTDDANNTNNPKINDLYIVSIGTGKEKEKLDHNKAREWGAIGWARPLIDILLSASGEVVDYQMRQIFGNNGVNNGKQQQYQQQGDKSPCYVRLEPELRKAKPEMDDASKENIRNLIDAGECFVKDNAELLDEVVNQLRIKN
jgi:patatin-like phospholipase/acyl hydrolase